MKVLDRLGAAWTAFTAKEAAAASETKAFVVDAGPGGMSVMNGETLGSLVAFARANVDPARVDALLSPIVMACLATITRNFGQARPMVMRKIPGEKQPVPMPDHHVTKRLLYPSQQLTLSDLWGAPLIDYNTLGDGYWRKVPARLVGRVGEFYPLPASQVRPRWYDDGWAPAVSSEFIGRWIAYYEYRDRGRIYIIPADEMVHMRTELDWRRGGRNGIPPFRSVALDVHTDGELTAYEAAVATNMGSALFIQPEGEDTDYTPAEVSEYEAKVDARIGGGRRGKVFYSNVRVKTADIGRPPKEMMTHELRKPKEERAAAVLNVPLLAAGFGTGDAATYDNLATAYEQLWLTSLIPMQDAIGEDLTISLLEEDEIHAGYFVGFDRSDVRALAKLERESRKEDREEFAGGAIDYHELLRRRGQPASAGQPNFICIPTGTTTVPVGEMPSREAPPSLERPAADVAADDADLDADLEAAVKTLGPEFVAGFMAAKASDAAPGEDDWGESLKELADLGEERLEALLGAGSRV